MKRSACLSTDDLPEEDDTTRERGPRCREELFLLFEGLGYRTEPVPIPDEHHPLWALDGDADVRLTWVGSLSSNRRGFQILLVERGEEGLSEDCASWQTRWAGRLWRRNRAFRGILACATPDWGELLLSTVVADGHAERPGLRHVRLTSGPQRADTLERVQRIAVKPTDTGPETLARRLAEDLDLIHVTRSFYARFRQARDQIAQAWLGLPPDAGDEPRQELALLTLSRLLFLYFLQRKRLLDGREDFLRDAVRAACATPGRRLYRDLLQPLFFGVLNTPQELRSDAAARLGSIPYLNGGLFEPSGLEVQHPQLDLPGDVVQKVFRELLERYTFTIREDGQGLGVDPEMLGRVFEGLMSPDTRGDSGTFFTPRALVDTLVDQSFSELLSRLGVPAEKVPALMEPGPPGLLPIAPGQARTIREQLDHVAILDPACGSGAFLVGTLTRLEQLHRRLATIAGAAAPKNLRRRIIRRNLYGIDISPAAVRLCELRLWLAILDETHIGEQVKPLPNLDHRIRQGDALLEPIDWSDTAADLRAIQDAAHDMEDLKLQYARASSDAKAYMRARLHDAEVNLFQALIERRITRLEVDHRQLLAAIHAPALFDAAPTPPQQLTTARLEIGEKLAELRRLLAYMDEEGRVPGFSPLIHFPEVMARGGFDLIIGNPPWVRIHAIPAARREQLRRRYRSVRNSAWTAGGMLRHLKGFASQVDLSVCFVERAVELLKEQGVLGLWIPSKLMRTLYGGGIRKLLMTHARPVRISELGDGHFTGATTYPCALLAIKGPHPPSPRVFVTLEGAQGRDIPLEQLRWNPDDLASPWIAAHPTRSDVRLHGRLVGDHPGLKICRGVMTGLNQAFIIKADDPQPQVAPEHLLPLLRGGHITAWRWWIEDQILWTHDTTHAAPLPCLPEDLSATLTPMEEKLKSRSDIRSTQDHRWWRLFRTGPHILSPRVVWRDLGTQLEAAAVPALKDGRPLIPLNTVYYIPTETYERALLLAAWLNASSTRDRAAAAAERASSGYRRFFGWVISLLPLPEPLDLALRPGPDAWDAALSSSPALAALLELSRDLHLNPNTPNAQTRVDALVADLYRQSSPHTRLCTPRKTPSRGTP